MATEGTESEVGYCRGSGNGWVYLVRDVVTNLHKVGKSCNPATRLRLLANATPNEIWLVWCVPTNVPRVLERQWMTLWAPKRVFGEWFRLNDDDVKHFKSFRSVRYTQIWTDVPVPTSDPFAIELPRKKGGRTRTPIVVGGPIGPRRL